MQRGPFASPFSSPVPLSLAAFQRSRGTVFHCRGPITELPLTLDRFRIGMPTGNRWESWDWHVHVHASARKRGECGRGIQPLGMAWAAVGKPDFAFAFLPIDRPKFLIEWSPDRSVHFFWKIIVLRKMCSYTCMQDKKKKLATFFADTQHHGFSCHPSSKMRRLCPTLSDHQ